MAKEVKEKTIYFVRHGQTKANVTSVFQAPDTPLNNIGQDQAKKIAERVKNISFSALVASPFPRAKETALIIGEVTNKIPEYSDLFTELIKPSRIVGKCYEDKEAHETYHRWREGLHSYGVKVEDGESYEELVERMDKALNFLKNKDEEAIVVVTHGLFLRALLFRAVLGDSFNPESLRRLFTHMQTENTGISVLRYTQTYTGMDWSLFTYNDHAHLG